MTTAYFTNCAICLVLDHRACDGISAAADGHQERV